MAAALIDPYWNDWLDLLIRWLHVIAGIVWIGTSFYFVALDNHLGPAEGAAGRRRRRRRRVVGDPRRRLLPHLEVHGRAARAARAAALVQVGGLHDVALGLRAARRPLLPRRGDVPDRPVRSRTSRRAAAITLSLLGLGAAWVLYDVACRVIRIEALMAVFLFGLVVASAYAASEVFSAPGCLSPGRRDARDDHGGERPLQHHPGALGADPREGAGREPDPAPGLEAKRRSVHNNYLTLPVVFTMISNHFAFTYGHDHAWLVLVALVVIGAWMRHFFNLRHAGRNAWWIPVDGGGGGRGAGDRDPPGRGRWNRIGPAGVARTRRRRSSSSAAFRATRTNRRSQASRRRRAGSRSTRWSRPRRGPTRSRRRRSTRTRCRSGTSTGMTDDGARAARRLDRRRRSRFTPCSRSRPAAFALRRALRGGAGAADGRRVPRDPPARGPDHPLPLERRVELDPVGRPRPRDRPRERDVAIRTPASSRSTRAARARRSCSSRTATATSRARPAQLWANHFATLVEGQEQLKELGRLTLWEGAQPISFRET